MTKIRSRRFLLRYLLALAILGVLCHIWFCVGILLWIFRTDLNSGWILFGGAICRTYFNPWIFDKVEHIEREIKLREQEQ